jgi:outer membrane receptor protein involved in Fe transport
MRKPIALAFSSLAAGAIATPALAQQLATPASSTATATVEVKANADTLRQNDSASRTVVGHEELVKYGDRSALDAMKRLPGVTVTDGGVRMRGLGNGYTQVLVDGQRMPSGFSLESLAPDAIEKIEVIRAATAEYSTQSIAGTINIVLRKSVDKGAGARAGELKLGTGGGPGLRAPGITLGMSGKEDGFGYNLGASLNHTERAYWSEETVSSSTPGGVLSGLRTEHSQYAQRFNAANANARLSWALGGGDTLSWNTFLNSGLSRGTEDNRTTTLVGPAYPYPLLPAAFRIEAASLRSELRLVKRFDGSARLDANLVLDSSRQDRRLARQGVRDDVLVLDSLDTGKVHDNTVTATGKYLVPLLEGHALAFGWDAGRLRNSQHDMRSDLTLPGGSSLETDTRFHATVDRLAVYGQDEWTPRAGWSIYLGARWEGVRTRTEGADFTPVAATYHVFSPLMQTLWKIPGSKQDQLRLALTRTYRAPPLRDLIPSRFYASFNTEVSPDYLGNPRLRPELATGIDLAFEHYFALGGLVSLSATTRSIRDFIRSTTTFDGLRWVSAPLNQGDAEVRSLALETKLPLKTLGVGWPVEMRANLSRNWSRVDAVPGPGNRLDRQPRWSANLGADYTGKTLAAGAGYTFVSGGWTRSSDFQSAYGGVTRDLEAYAAFKFDPLRQLRLTARNLLATDRLSGSRYADAAAATQRLAAGPTYRNWRLQYEQRFR